MAAETKAKKRGFRAPHALVIMVILVCITALLTYVVPAGEFDRTEDPVTGNTIVVADSYHRVEQAPVSLLKRKHTVFLYNLFPFIIRNHR